MMSYLQDFKTMKNSLSDIFHFTRSNVTDSKFHKVHFSIFTRIAVAQNHIAGRDMNTVFA